MAKATTGKPKKFTTIEDDASILPDVVADTTIGGLERWFDDQFPDREKMVNWLVHRQATLYRNSESWRKKMNASGNKGRDTLYLFMQHWTAARLKGESKADGIVGPSPAAWKRLYPCLPSGYGWDQYYDQREIVTGGGKSCLRKK